MNTEHRTSHPPIKVPFFYGWVILAVGALGVFFSGPGQTYSISLFINSYIEEFGWSRSMVSGFYSVATLSAGFILPIIGRKIDHIGYRKMIMIVPFLLAVSCLWMSITNQAWMLFIGFMFLRLFGQGSMSLIPAALAPQWFIKRRGIALSLMGLGGVAGSTFIPLINNWLITNTSISFAWQFWALLLVGVMIPIGGFFVRNRPEEVGLLPDGVTKEKEIEILHKNSAALEEVSWQPQQAMKTKVFWMILFCGFDSVSTGVIWPNYFGRVHLASIRAMAMTGMVIGSALGPLPFGFAYDWFGGYTQIMVMMLVFPIVGSVSLLLANKPTLPKS